MKKIITIGREYGAGGGEIGRRVSRELDIPYYDRDIILKTALASGKLAPEQVRRWDERVPSSFGFAQSLFDFYNRPLDEELWKAQCDAIRTLANQESCVIVGRNSDYILGEFDHCLHVFVHAGLQWRINRMVQMYHLTPEQAAKDAHEADRARKRYCEYYTRKSYGDARSYDLTLNTEKLGVDRAVQMVLEAAQAI